jgi:DNA invertase Pin-like site-specific DNA recombinase
MIDKINESHLNRDAFVYIRQSTQGQVEHNTESSRRQYGLAQRARQLGWESVELIDEDLGCSGSGERGAKGL